MKTRHKLILFALLLVLPSLAACGDGTATTKSDTPASSLDSSLPTEEPAVMKPTTSIPKQDPTSVPTSEITVTGNRVNIRTGPSTDYPVIDALPNGEVVLAIGFNASQTWVQIELPSGEIGWISADLVDIEDIEKLAVITDISAAPAVTTSEQAPTTSAGNSGTSDNKDAPIVTTSEQVPTTSAGNSGTSGNTDNPFQCEGGCATAPDSSCTIKGNVNSSGERIYHVPGGSFYNRTDIKPEEGDRWFCTSAEAQAAGFRESAR